MKITTQRKIDRIFGALLIFLLKIPTVLLGVLLKRDHSLTVQGDIVILKILGGGSLMIATPALLAIKASYPNRKIKIICSKQVLPFAQLTGCFDEYFVIETNSLASLFFSSLKTLFRCWKIDTVIDLEIHSKMSTIFSLLLCARNRIGFYMNWSAWKDGLMTHSIFYNDSSPIFQAYDQVAFSLGSELKSMEETSKYFRHHNQLNSFEKMDVSSRYTVAMACFSSELCPEREFSPQEWLALLINKYKQLGQKIELILLGGPGDVLKSKNFESFLTEHLDSEYFLISNKVGQLSLRDSTKTIFEADELLTIDSGLNHIARFLGRRISSYWGPTDPRNLLRPNSELDEKIHYQKIYCSPCVHVVEIPPCRGDNVCMRLHLQNNPESVMTKKWLVSLGGLRG